LKDDNSTCDFEFFDFMSRKVSFEHFFHTCVPLLQSDSTINPTT